VTIDRMALDGVEVAEFLRGKLHQPRITLVGLSWGTVLGIHMAKTRPDLFYAYVGTGQIANYRQGRVLAYAQLMTEARARSDRKAIRELERVGSPPYDSGSKEGQLRTNRECPPFGTTSRPCCSIRQSRFRTLLK
jgi:pimeloyl-ACP methyl ester carboxylesterase